MDACLSFPDGDARASGFFTAFSAGDLLAHCSLHSPVKDRPFQPPSQ